MASKCKLYVLRPFRNDNTAISTIPMAKKNSPVHITGGAFAAQPTAAKIHPTNAKALRLADAYFESMFIEYLVP